MTIQATRLPSDEMDAPIAMRVLPACVYVEETGTPRGRGVFAGRAFKQGDLVESCPVVPYAPLPDRRLPQELKRIVFGWGKLAQLEHVRPAIALGYGSLYNHGNPASLRCEADVANHLLQLIATRDIGIDEELTINYNNLGGDVSTDDRWFRTHGVTRIDS